MKILRMIHPIDPDLDEEVRELCYTINAIPGIETISSCFGHGKEVTRIFLKLNSNVNSRNEGLFFLSRCIDYRYSIGSWTLSLGVGEVMKGSTLPLFLILKSTWKGDKAVKEIEELIENLNWHINHYNFIKGYMIDIHAFHFIIKEEGGR